MRFCIHFVHNNNLRKSYPFHTVFSVDYLLPIEVEGNWIGIVYRNGHCIMALMDRYDITNKAILCNPSFDIQSMERFKNQCNRLKVVVDDQSKKREEMNWKPTISTVPMVQPIQYVVPMMIQYDITQQTTLCVGSVVGTLPPIAINIPTESYNITEWSQWTQYTSNVITNALEQKDFFKQFIV